MKGLNSTILILLAGLLAGIMCYRYFSINLFSGYLLLFTTLCIFIFIHSILYYKRRQSIFSGVLPFLIFIGLGIVIANLNDPLLSSDHFSNVNQSKNSKNLILTIRDELKPGFYDQRYIARISQIDSQFVSGLVILNILKDTSNSSQLKFQIGDRLFTNQSIEDLKKARNPYQFDYAAYLNSQKIYAQITARNVQILKLSKNKKSFSGYAHHSRNYLKNKVDNYPFHKDSKAVMNALLLGQRNDLSDELQESYINAGVIHILAVSGLHVGILMLILQLILKPLGNYPRSRILRGLIVIICIWLFAILTGSSASVLRAATMFSFIQVGILLNQRQASINALIISAFFLILFNPNIIFEVGFQLSYAAVFFIMWLYPILEKVWQPRNKILKYYWQLVVISFTAQIGVLPLSLYYFHQFPGIFLIANMVIIPALGALLILGIIILIFASLDILPLVITSIYDSILIMLNNCVRYLAQYESLLITNIYFSAALVFIGYAIIISWGSLLQKWNYSKLCFFLLTLIALPLSLIISRSNQSKKRLYILHNYNSSLIAIQDRNKNLIIQSEKDAVIPLSIIANFKENQLVNTVCQDKIEDYYHIEGRRVLRVDSLGLYDLPLLNPDYILLTHSPKINLDRLISIYPNVQIISDATNYKSYTARWEATCIKQKIPFHNTYEKGFYMID